MKTKKQIKAKILIIQNDLELAKTLEPLCETATDKMFAAVAVGASKQQIKLLKWVLK